VSSTRNLGVLVALQALLSTGNTTIITLAPLAGHALAADPALATLPITGWVVGGALTTLGASLLMRRVGRRAGFTVGGVIGLAGAALSILALVRGSFWLLVAATMVLGAANAFGQYYRFAAAEASEASRRARAISWVMAGGLIGGVVGPKLAALSRDVVATEFVGAYLILVALLVVTIAVVQLLALPPPPVEEAAAPARPLGALIAQPAFIVAVIAGALGYGVMNFLMTATTLAMSACGHPFDDAATVISWHIVGMYAPSFFTGDLIRRFGVGPVLAAGVALEAGCVAIALAGVDVAHFWAALLLLGVGWNFLYIGGTALLTTTYQPAEKARAQGLNDMAIFSVMAISSLASGILFDRSGWHGLNLVAIPALVAVAIALAWWALRRPRAAI
jgi:MFS family permease